MSNNGDGTSNRINDFYAVKISLADPKKIRENSKGEVKKPETVNYRTYRSERDGLFCERIFGPEKDWECACGKHRGVKDKGVVCERCGVQVTQSKVRRERMGHIELAAPVVHIWFFKGTSSRLATLLEMKASHLEKVVYFQDYVVTDAGDTPLKVGELLDEDKYRTAISDYGPNSFKAEMGAEAIRKLLQRLDVVEASKSLREELKTCPQKERRKVIINRLKLIEALRNCKHENKPTWIVLDVIPVIPPDMRPLVMLESGTFATSDLNDLYRRIINRNNRLRRLVDLDAPDVIVRNEKRMLQQSVDALFDNMRCKRPVLGSGNRALKSLTDMIKGKQGRFRENLLGKRVDYSARSVIVVGPHMRLHQCGLPKLIALELYQPFIIRRLRDSDSSYTIKSAKKMIERRDNEVWDILEQVIKNHPVLLNRAPTLHRMGIQAFEPMLIEGKAIKLHPLVCKGFNADFDGDQMAVHLPLSLEAQVEAHTLMLSTNNIFSPANGKPIISPSQDIVMGCYYITIDLPGMKGEGMKFASFDEVMLAYALGKVHLQAKIWTRMPKGRFLKNDPSVNAGKLFETTPGRIIFNQILDWNQPGREFSDDDKPQPFYNIPQQSKELATVISDCYELNGRRRTIDLLDRMMRLGFEESTKSGLSFAADDLITPPEKKQIMENADKEVQGLKEQADMGVISNDERYNKVIDVWTRVRQEITEKMLDSFRNDVHKTEEEAVKAGDKKRRRFGYVNPVYLMAHSGARGGDEQIRQLAGIRGLMAKPNGMIIESPVRANFLEGLSVLEYFSSTHGARKGLSDTALKTADSGYLTRRLADVAQNCVVTTYDCGTKNGISKSAIPVGDKKIPLSQSILGRVTCDSVVNPTTDEVIVKANELITVEVARKIEELGIEKLRVRSPMTCEAELGVCSLCYGMDLSTSKMVEEGMAVGIIAAQSIGEPGTQLTMRTFHVGGTASHSAEANEIKTKYAGTIRFAKMDVVDNPVLGGKLVLSCKADGGVEICNNRGLTRETYLTPEGTVLKVEEGQQVEPGQILGTLDPHIKYVIAKSAGIVQFGDVVEGDTATSFVDEATGASRLSIVELKGDKRPHIDVRSFDGSKINEGYQLPSKTQIDVKDGQSVERGTILARMPQNTSGTQDITSGLPRVTEIFEARNPKDPAVITEISGVVEISEKRSHGKKQVIIHSKSEIGGEPNEKAYDIPQGKHIRVFTGDEVRAGQSLTDGIVAPRDILRVSGEEAVQNYLVQEVQNLYRSQNVSINDKHIEIIVSQMLRKVKIEDGGDTSLLVGDVVDKQVFNRRNKELADLVKIEDPGDTDFERGELVKRDVFNEKNAEFFEDGRRVATCRKPKQAKGAAQLLGITKAAVQSDSFLSAASFQETTKVLTEAALACKVDRLIGLKENVILGRLIPAGTGFQRYQRAKSCYISGVVDNNATSDVDDYDVKSPLLDNPQNEESDSDGLGTFNKVSNTIASDSMTIDENVCFPTVDLMSEVVEDNSSFDPSELSDMGFSGVDDGTQGFDDEN